MGEHCEAQVGWRHTPDEAHLFAPVTCRQVVGLRRWLDANGRERAACSRPGHRYDVQRRYGLLVDTLRAEAAFEANSAEMRELADADESDWSEAELREAYGR